MRKLKQIWQYIRKFDTTYYIAFGIIGINTYFFFKDYDTDKISIVCAWILIIVLVKLNELRETYLKVQKDYIALLEIECEYYKNK